MESYAERARGRIASYGWSPSDFARSSSRTTGTPSTTRAQFRKG